MTTPLYADAYLREAEAIVLAQTEGGGLLVDASLFYPAGGGQPGDAGQLAWDGGTVTIASARKAAAPDGSTAVELLPAAAENGGAVPELPPVGTRVHQTLDWTMRYGHMRVHTALHLLSVVVPLPVTGGAITAEKGRLDFDMEAPPSDKGALEDQLRDLVARDLPVSEEWITAAELAANPGLVKTISVAPPTGAGRVRLVRIGEGESTIDLQPCGGTHVARAGEIGALRIGKIEKKGKRNRRITLHLD